jgi:hypothetical protein
MGPQGARGPSSTGAGLFLTLSTGELIPFGVNSPITFDNPTTPPSSSDFTYDATTGIVTLVQPGTYLIGYAINDYPQSATPEGVNLQWNKQDGMGFVTIQTSTASDPIDEGDDVFVLAGQVVITTTTPNNQIRLFTGTFTLDFGTPFPPDVISDLSIVRLAP